MKNLWKAADRGMNAKFIWQNNAPSGVESLSNDTRERLDYLKLDIATQNKWGIKINEKANNAMDKIIPLLNNPTKNAQAIADYTINRSLGDTDLNNMYRTEMVSRLNKHFETSGIWREDASGILLKAMEKMQSSPSLFENLKTAMNAIKYGSGSQLSSFRTRQFATPKGKTDLAAEMKKGIRLGFDINGGFDGGFEGYEIDNCEISTGASMTKINPLHLSKFKIKNAIMVDGPNGGKQIIALMENGCKGNLVIINVKEKQVRQPYSKIIDCYRVFFNADGTPTGERIKVSNDCDDDPIIVENDCVDCDVIGTATAADVTKEMLESNFLEESNMSITQWNNLSPASQRWEMANYQSEVASKNVTNLEIFNQISDIVLEEMESRRNPNILSGGLLELFLAAVHKKDPAQLARRINRKLKRKGIKKTITAEEINLAIKTGDAELAKSTNRGRYSAEEFQAKLDKMSPKDRKALLARAGKQAEKLGVLSEFNRSVQNGHLYRIQKMALSDLLVIAASFGTDFPLFHVRLPRCFGTKIQQLPGDNAISITSLGDDIGNNFTGHVQETFDSLDKEIQLGDNAAMLGAELMRDIYRLNNELKVCTDATKRAEIFAKINQQNTRLLAWQQNMKNDMEQMLKAVDENEHRYKGKLRSARRHNYKFLEGTDGRRRETRKDYKYIKNALKTAQNGDYSHLINSEMRKKLNQTQKNLIAEINDDFGSNLEFAGFGKEITNAKSFEINIRRAGRNLSVKMIVAKYDENGAKIPKGKETQTPGKWEMHLANNWKDTAKFGKKSYDKLNKSGQRKFDRLVNEYSQDFQDRTAEVKELHKIGTIIDGYAKAINVRKVRENIYSMEGNRTNLDNVVESSSYATLTRIERYIKADSATRNALLDPNCDDCFFSNATQSKMQEFFDIDETQDPNGKIAKFRELQRSTNFEQEYDLMVGKIGEIVKELVYYKQGNGVRRFTFKLANGDICSPKNVQNVLKKGENIYVYDNNTGEIQKTVVVSKLMLSGLVKMIDSTPAETSSSQITGKDDLINDLRNSYGMTDGEIRQYLSDNAAELGLSGTVTTYGGEFFTETITKNAVKGGLKFLPGGVANYLATAGTAIGASYLGQKLENNAYRTTYPMQDVYDYSGETVSSNSHEKREIVTLDNGEQKEMITNKATGQVIFQEINNYNMNVEINFYGLQNTPQSKEKVLQLINEHPEHWETAADFEAINKKVAATPDGSNIKISGITQNKKTGKLNASDCLCNWVRTNAGPTSTAYEWNTNTMNTNKTIVEYKNLTDFVSMFSEILGSDGFSNSASEVKQFLTLNKKYADKSSYNNAMNLLNNVSPDTKMTIVSIGTLLSGYRLINGESVYFDKKLAKFKIATADGRTSQDLSSSTKKVSSTEKAAAKIETVETFSKTIGKYFNLPYNAVKVVDGPHQTVVITLDDGKTVNGYYDSNVGDTRRKFTKL